MGGSWRALAAVVAMVALIAGCSDGEEGDQAGGGTGRLEGGRPATVRPAEATRETRCEVGGHPDYFVPGGDDGPFAIIGCAWLGVSGKPVEFSADFERIGREDGVCMNPAYRGRRQMGVYIPAICVRDPISRRLDVVGVEIPRQAVRDYQLVIWGTADPATRQVLAHYEDEETTAAVFTVRRSLARAVGATRAFSVFVVELYPDAACHRVRMRADGASAPSATRIGSRPKLCSAT